MSEHIKALWHKDMHGRANPNFLVGKRFFYPATGLLYVVTGFSLGVGLHVTGSEWVIHFDREDRNFRHEFGLSRPMHEFLDGRYVEVK